MDWGQAMSEEENASVRSGDFVVYATEIIAAYVRNNTVAATDLPDLIRLVHRSLVALQDPAPEPETLKPAVSVKKSIHNDYLICLEDGLKFKSLKRHLRSKYDLSPEEYREKWGLPAEYPMVAPGYSAQRSKLAKKMGLGRQER